MSWRLRRGSSTKLLRAVFEEKSRGQRSMLFGWDVRRCLFHRRRPSVNSVGRLFPSMEPYGVRPPGFKQRVMPDIAIVAALEREIWPLVKNWRVTDREYEGRR